MKAAEDGENAHFVCGHRRQENCGQQDSQQALRKIVGMRGEARQQAAQDGAQHPPAESRIQRQQAKVEQHAGEGKCRQRQGCDSGQGDPSGHIVDRRRGDGDHPHGRARQVEFHHDAAQDGNGGNG